MRKRMYVWTVTLKLYGTTRYILLMFWGVEKFLDCHWIILNFKKKLTVRIWWIKTEQCFYDTSYYASILQSWDVGVNKSLEYDPRRLNRICCASVRPKKPAKNRKSLLLWLDVFRNPFQLEYLKFIHWKRLIF